MRMMWPDERGVLLLRYENWKEVWGDIGTIHNALNMDRCEGIRLGGGTFCRDLLECDVVRLLLKGFREHARREPEIEDGGWWDH